MFHDLFNRNIFSVVVLLLFAHDFAGLSGLLGVGVGGLRKCCFLFQGKSLWCALLSEDEFNRLGGRNSVLVGYLHDHFSHTGRHAHPIYLDAFLRFHVSYLCNICTMVNT